MRAPRVASLWLAILAGLAGLFVLGCGSVTPVARDGGGDGSLGADAPADSGGTQCNSDQDCKQYSDGVGGCCGACIPAADPQPATVQCLLPCTTTIKSCGCSNHQCVASTS